MNKELILNTFSKFKKITSTSVEKFEKQYPSEVLELKQILDNNPAWVSIQNVIIGIIENKTLKNCKTCGKTIPFTKWEQDFCSLKCINQNQDVRDKIRSTCLKKYGVDNVAKSNEFIKKSKQTCLEKYGVSNTSQLKESKDKSKQTCLEKYGVEYTSQSKQMKDAAKKTCLEKYGVSHYVNTEKQRKTILKKSFEKYLKFSEVEPLFSLDEYTGIEYYKEYEWRCKKCGNMFNDHLYSHFPTCPICYKKYYNGVSLIEKEFVKFINEIYKSEVIENDRLIISPYELDVVIPEKKIAFEFNGTFWHSENSPGFKKNENKCLMKTNLCNEKGFKLIHIWERDWITKNELIKNKIKAILGVCQTKIYARKCTVKEISSKDKNEFLNFNHIQGEDKSNVKLGLFYENELVAVMTFGKPRFNKNYEYELIRYATSKHIIGGAGKLLTHFERNYNPKSIITYADRFYSNGNMYEKIGFKLSHVSNPGYFYINSNGVKISRYKAQKHSLKKLLGDKYHDDLSEFENMTLAKFYRVYDCGNLVYVKNC